MTQKGWRARERTHNSGRWTMWTQTWKDNLLTMACSREQDPWSVRGGCPADVCTGRRAGRWGPCCPLLAIALLSTIHQPFQILVAQRAQNPGGGSPEAKVATLGGRGGRGRVEISLQSSPPGRTLRVTWSPQSVLHAVTLE